MIFICRCDVIPFDMTGNNNDTGGPIDEKSNQWFGASVSSSGEDGVIVVSDGISSFCWRSYPRLMAPSARLPVSVGWVTFKLLQSRKKFIF